MQQINQDRLFIIIGPPRSGTSLLQEIMNCFDGFCNNRESRIGGPGGRSCYDDIADKDDFTALEQYITSKWDKTFFVEKMPASINCLPQLNKHFPDAHYLFIERDPREIHLSIMNMHIRRNDDVEYKRGHMRIGGERLDMSLPTEVFVAKEVLDMVKRQAENKPTFKNQYTIRYEQLRENLKDILSDLEKTFAIKCDFNKAFACLSTPSYSSLDNTYDVKEIIDPRARATLNVACKLWDYQIPSNDRKKKGMGTKPNVKRRSTH